LKLAAGKEEGWSSTTLSGGRLDSNRAAAGRGHDEQRSAAPPAGLRARSSRGFGAVWLDLAGQGRGGAPAALASGALESLIPLSYSLPYLAPFTHALNFSSRTAGRGGGDDFLLRAPLFFSWVKRPPGPPWRRWDA